MWHLLSSVLWVRWVGACTSWSLLTVLRVRWWSQDCPKFPASPLLVMGTPTTLRRRCVGAVMWLDMLCECGTGGQVSEGCMRMSLPNPSQGGLCSQLTEWRPVCHWYPQCRRLPQCTAEWRALDHAGHVCRWACRSLLYMCALVRVNNGVLPIGCAKAGLSTAACVTRSQKRQTGCRPASSTHSHWLCPCVCVLRCAVGLYQEVSWKRKEDVEGALQQLIREMRCVCVC